MCFTVRLRHNVIKTGIRMISLSYSRISLADIALKLQLDSPQDAEYIIAKAIRDGVIEASLDHEAGYMRSKVMSHAKHILFVVHVHTTLERS